jgi:hypothetical protein
MYGSSKAHSCSAPTHGAASSGRGVQWERPPSRRCKGQATAERGGQVAACAQEMEHVHLELSDTRSKEQDPRVAVSDCSSGSDSGRLAASHATHLEGMKTDLAASSTSPPRSSLSAPLLSTARTHKPRSIRTEAPSWLGRRSLPAAGAAEADERADVAGTEATQPSPPPPPPAAAAPLATPCVQASYLSILAGGLLAAESGGGLGRTRRGEGRTGVEDRRAEAGCQETQGSTA